MNPSAGNESPLLGSRKFTTTSRILISSGLCLAMIAMAAIASRGNPASHSTGRLHKNNPFFNPKVKPPGITVDQVVSLKEVPVPEPMAVVIPAPTGICGGTCLPIPGPGTDLNFQPLTTEIVQNQPALVKLGKALFWDMQVGSDGVQACATCHYNAGADIRTKNQISPNLSDTNFHLNNPPNGDTFGGDNSWGDATVPYTANDPLTPNPPGPGDVPPAQLNVPGFPQFNPNYDVTSADFPFNDWFRPTELTPRGPGVTIFDEFANVSRDTNDIMASQGVRLNLFCGLPPSCNTTLPGCTGATSPGGVAECSVPEKDIFNTLTPGIAITQDRVRRAMPRNSPTMINAVFNFDNLWDGKASFIFNGVNPFGFRDRTHTLQEVINNKATSVFVRITNSSLASVAAGVPVAPNNIAMAYDKRTFPDVGKKLVSLRPLAKQFVHPQDSVLGSLSRAILNPDGTLSGSRGLKPDTYESMVKAAFQKQWWSSPTLFSGFTQMETNFSLFFALAVQAYEATLVSDNSNFDKFMGAPHPVRANNGNPIPPNPNALTPRQRVGLSVFQDDNANLGTHCADCHILPVTTGHTVLDYQPDSQGVPSLSTGEAIEFMIMGDNGEEANYDHGMYNIGVRRSCITGIDPSTCPSHTEDRGRGANATKNNVAFANPVTGTAIGISSIARAAGTPPVTCAAGNAIVTVTTAAANPLAAGQVVTIFGVGDTTFNGLFNVCAVNSGTQFTYVQTNKPDSSSGGGWAIGPNAPFPLSLVEITALRGDPSCDSSPISHVGCLPPDVARFIPDVPMLPRRVTNGAFKAPNLRNIKFTGPYFHVGDSATLRQVVEFYTRGGNFPNTNLHDKTVDVDGIPPLAFPEFNPVAEANIEALVDFLAEGLKDDRVAFERGPFDHPELKIPNGSPKGNSAKDLFISVPAVGRNGRPTELPTFLHLDPQQP